MRGINQLPLFDSEYSLTNTSPVCRQEGSSPIHNLEVYGYKFQSARSKIANLQILALLFQFSFPSVHDLTAA